MLSSPNILHVSPASSPCSPSINGSSPCSSVDAIELSLWQSQKGVVEQNSNPSPPEAMVFPLPKEIFQLPKSMLSRGHQEEQEMDQFDVESGLHELPEPIVIPSTSALFDPDDDDEDVKMIPVILQERH